MNERTPDEQRRLAKQLIAQLAQLDNETLDVRKALNQYMTVPMRQIIKALPGKTKVEKARRAGVSRMTLWYWENGKRPSGDQAKRLAKLTGFTVRQIVGG